MASIKSYKDLDAWQAAMAVAEECYQATKSLPQTEQYGLTAQMRRAAVSVAANIAEGHQKTRAGYVHHVQIALGSLAELETQLTWPSGLSFWPRTLQGPPSRPSTGRGSYCTDFCDR